MKTTSSLVVILTLAGTSSCSSALPPQTKDEFFRPLDRKPRSERRLPDAPSHVEAPRTEVKMSRERPDAHAEVDSLKKENSRLRDSLGRLQDLISQIRRQAQPKEAIGTKNPVYTVQIGAFGKGHALRAFRLRETAQERFADQVVLNKYDPVAGLYRVGVGEFETREDASRLRKELMRKFPMDYLECWVNHVVK